MHALRARKHVRNVTMQDLAFVAFDTAPLRVVLVPSVKRDAQELNVGHTRSAMEMVCDYTPFIVESCEALSFIAGKRRLATKAEEKVLAGMSFFHLDDRTFSSEFQQLEMGMLARASHWQK